MDISRWIETRGNIVTGVANEAEVPSPPLALL
jgi:hypothetical protein